MRNLDIDYHSLSRERQRIYPDRLFLRALGYNEW
jgi:hypothetical protein